MIVLLYFDTEARISMIITDGSPQNMDNLDSESSRKLIVNENVRRNAIDNTLAM